MNDEHMNLEVPCGAEFCGREETEKRMNGLGAAGTPFLFFVSYDMTEAFVAPIDEVRSEDILFNFNGVSNDNEGAQTGHDAPYVWEAGACEFEEYEQSFDIVRRHLMKGNSYLVNLSCATPVRTNLALRDIYRRAEAKYKLWVRGRFTVFSPEPFVKIDGGHIASFPMKGTIDAGLPHAAEVLTADEKEAAEHATITDLIRNDLSTVATGVHVARYRYIEALQTSRGAILQSSSEIAGTLPAAWQRQIGTTLFAMLPAGSVTGAPKPMTCRIIAEAEHHKRGFYCGIAGVFDGRRLDSCVMIRFVGQSADGLVYKSGGGITARSTARSEYDEMISKIYIPSRQ